MQRFKFQYMRNIPGHNSGDSGEAYVLDARLVYPQTVVPERFAVDSVQEVFGRSVESNELLTSSRQPEKFLRYESYNFIIFSGLLVLLFCFYTILICRYRNNIGLLFKAVTLRVSSEAVSDQQSLLFRRFVNGANWMGAFAILAIIMKLYLIFYLEEGSVIPVLLDRLLPLIAVGSVVAVFVYRLLAHLIMLAINKDAEMVKEIKGFNKIVFAASAMVFVPLVMVYGFLPWNSSLEVLSVVLLPVLVPFLYYAYKSYQLFVRRKLSILQWFLYLCAVEILPISYFVLLVLRDC